MATPQPSPAHSWPDHFRAVLTLGVPLVGSSLAQFAIHLTDSLMLGRYDARALAAVTLAGSLHFIIFIVGAGFGFAVTPLVASAEERGDHTEARRVTRMALWLVMAYGVLLSPVYLFSEALFLAIGQTADMAAKAQTYLRLIWFTLIPSLAVATLRSYLSAAELTGIILRSTIGAALANVLFNRVLIFGAFGLPGYGIRGAAVASIITVMMSLIWLVIYIRRHLPQQQLFRRMWVGDGWAARRVFALGMPIGLTSLAEGGLFSASSVMVGWIGEIPLAAHGVALQLASLFFMAHVGLSQAATVRAGRALGRGDGPGLRRGGLAALAVSGAVVAVTVAVFLILPRSLTALFIDGDDPARPQIMALSVQLLAVAALFQLVDAVQIMALGLLRGVQDTKVPLMLAGVSYWGLGLSSSYLLAFPLGLGAVGVWLGLCVGLGTAAVLMSARFWARWGHWQEA